jgi:ribosome-associated protein
MISVTDIPEEEIAISAIRASGPGGQHVNKVATAIHLRFDISASSLPGEVKEGFARLKDRRISTDQVVTIKAQRSRSQEKNKLDALGRLDELLGLAQVRQKKRRPTRPGKGVMKRRLDSKTRQGRKKGLRKNVDSWD